MDGDGANLHRQEARFVGISLSLSLRMDILLLLLTPPVLCWGVGVCQQVGQLLIVLAMDSNVLVNNLFSTCQIF